MFTQPETVFEKQRSWELGVMSAFGMNQHFRVGLAPNGYWMCFNSDEKQQREKWLYPHVLSTCLQHWYLHQCHTLSQEFLQIIGKKILQTAHLETWTFSCIKKDFEKSVKSQNCRKNLQDGQLQFLPISTLSNRAEHQMPVLVEHLQVTQPLPRPPQTLAFISVKKFLLPLSSAERTAGTDSD